MNLFKSDDEIQNSTSGSIFLFKKIQIIYRSIFKWVYLTTYQHSVQYYNVKIFSYYCYDNIFFWDIYFHGNCGAKLTGSKTIYTYVTYSSPYHISMLTFNRELNSFGNIYSTLNNNMLFG